MKATATFAKLAGLIVMLAAPIHAQAQPQVGVWTSTDLKDGSRGFIAVNAALQIVFFDSDATFGCRESGGGPFIGFDENNGNSVSFSADGTVLIGYIEGACQKGGKNQNLSFDFAMRHFPEYDTVRSRDTDWDRTFIDPETFVANAFELEKLASGAWDFLGSFTSGDPQIIPGADCADVNVFRPSTFTMELQQTLDLRACDMAMVNFEGLNSNSLLREAYLRRAYIGADIHNADFSAADLGSATFNGAISFSNFRYADLRFMDFYQSAFHEVDFFGANLRGATDTACCATGNNLDFRRANLADADLRFMDLFGWIDFRNANLIRAQFNPDNVAEFIFFNTTCPDGSNSDDNGGICDLTWSQP